jgi:cytochrome c-type biogenesis protein CcmH
MKRLFVLLACLLLAFGAAAREAEPLAPDPAVERRLNAIAEELRCLVCQNESLASSRADLAMDLKREIREMVRAGRTDAEIRAFMVARYGDFVLYRPPLKPSTLLLWTSPFILLIAGFIALFLFLRRRREEAAAAELSPEEAARAAALLRGSAER